jgi:hypothetical protein
MNLSRAITLGLGLSLTCLGMSAPVFFIAAHQDDPQLFMGRNLYDDTIGGHDIILIYTTAGDGGQGGGGYRDTPYYRAREEGAISSMRLPASMALNTPDLTGWSTVTVAGKKVRRYRWRNVWSYFMRLPDGNVSGLGFEASQFASLEKLRSGAISSITAVDGSATYTSWPQVTSVIRSIVQLHSGPHPGWWANILDPSNDTNPNDHSDHVATGLAAMDALAQEPCNLALWLGYEGMSRPINMNSRDRQWKAGMFGALGERLSYYGYPSTWDDGHLSALERSYFRTIIRV